MKTKRLSPTDLAILAAGGSVNASVKDEPQLTEAQIAEAAAVEQARLATEKEKEGGEEDDGEGEGGDTNANVNTPNLQDQTNVINLLNTQSKEKDTQLIAAGVELATTKAALGQLQESQKGLLAIANGAVSNMRVALGLAAVDMSASGPAELVAEHTKLSTQFTSTFKAGGVAAVMPEKETQASAVANDGEHQARMKSVGAK